VGVNEVLHTGNEQLFAVFFHDLTGQRRAAKLQLEKAKAELLLLNMLPEDIAFRLKEDKKQIADHFPNCAILFADIVGFTAMTSNMCPVEVVTILNKLFSMFDVLVDKYDLNKVKTIGDCYMVTSHPDSDTNEVEIKHICCMGIDMIKAVALYNSDHPGYNLSLRVGINTGPVVAGVVGTKRFLYDLWGDAVNLASRMESTGQPGKIHVTRAVIDHVGADFTYESRGITHIKGKGAMETFFLLGQREGASPRPLTRVPRRVMRRRSQLVESLQTLKSSRNILDTKINEIESQVNDKI